MVLFSTANLIPHLQDLEQVEEWNEFGELRMVVNSVQDLGGMPATSNPIPATETKTEDQPAAPKPSTIKIQNPPVSKPEEKKDEMAVLALRQASTEAASKAQAKSDDKKEPAKEETKEEVPLASRAHRGSVACELPDTAPDSPTVKRPTLVPENAAMSSANFHVDNAEMLGLVGHHRGSRVPTLENAEQDKAVHELRKSISQESTSNLDAIRKEAKESAQTQSGSPIEEVPSPIIDDAVVAETKEELMEPNEPKGQAIAEVIAKAVEEPREAQAEIKKAQEAVEASSPKGTDDTKENAVPVEAQMPKSE